MKLSIIIPVYNPGHFLNQCIESVLKQTYKDFELIIINDGSTDDSKKVIEKYAEQDNRIKFFNQENKGIIKTVSRGVEIASGDYISFVDADDFCELNKYEVLMKHALSNDCDCVACGIKSDVNIRKCVAKPGYYETTKKLYKNIFLLGGYCTRYNKVIKNKILKEAIISYQNSGCNHFEDYIFFSSFFFKCKNYYICDEILCNVRVAENKNSTTKKMKDTYFDESKLVFETLYSIFKENGNSDLFWQTNNIYYNALMSSLISLCRTKQYSEAKPAIELILKDKFTKKFIKKIKWKYYPTSHTRDKLFVVLIKLRLSYLIFKILS